MKIVTGYSESRVEVFIKINKWGKKKKDFCMSTPPTHATL